MPERSHRQRVDELSREIRRHVESGRFELAEESTDRLSREFANE